MAVIGLQLTYVITTTQAAPLTSPLTAPVVFDSFTDIAGKLLQNHSGEIGAVWKKLPRTIGTAKISAANRLVGASTNRTVYLASNTPGTGEYEITGDIYVGTNQDDVALVGRVDPVKDSYYYAGYTNASTPKWHISKRVNGVTTYLKGSAQTLTRGSTYNVKFEIKDAAKKLYVKGPNDIDYVLKVMVTDNSIPSASQSGVLIGNGSDTTGYQLDNFTVTTQ